MALAAAAFAASQSSRGDGRPLEASPTADISIPLSVYVVHEAGGTAGSNLSSRRTEQGLLDIVDRAGGIWAPAGIRFDPVVVHTVDLPHDVVADLMAGDSASFMAGAGPTFTVPEPGAINGFYIPFAGGANGFTPRRSRVFFVADESSVHDERVTSHEIGHILGLGHEEQDPGRLMYGGTNGMVLTDGEISIARETAVGLPGVVVTPSTNLSTGRTTDASGPIPNVGGSMEGHTPRGFAGMGTGLFAGDNLNPGFPDGDGVQLFLTFDLPPGLTAPASAVIATDAMQTSGTPFEDLGALRAEPVSYDTFGPDLFDLAGDGDPVGCERVGDSGLTCDVTTSVVAAVANGAHRAQFRLKFDLAGDSDGTQDLAMFFRSDANTAESGIFTLTIEPAGG